MESRKRRSVTPDDFNIFDERAFKGRVVARAIDHAQPIPYSVTVRAHKFDDFLKTLTPKRFELLKLSQGGSKSIAELAVASGRDRSAVSRDIAALVELGLVSVVAETNAGHGIKKVVRPVAENIEISATLP